MNMLKKIMVATDFSSPAEDALQMAVFLVREFQAKMAIIHVVPEIRGLGIDRGGIRRMANDKLKEIKTGVRRKGVSGVETVLRFGNPFERIVEHAEELEANLIVMGAGKKDERYPLGTTAKRVMAHADVPVLAVKPGRRPVLKEILCPVDFSEASRRSLASAIHLSRALGSHLTVLTVFESVLSHLLGPSWRPDPPNEAIRAERYRDHYEEFLRGFEFEKFTWKKVFRRGKPHEEILRATRDIGADLLVLGSQGRTGLSRLLLGSTAEKVVREMPCSVLTLKPESITRFPLEREIVNLETHLRKGKEHLNKKEAEEAVAQFGYCLRKEGFFLPAWEGLAAAYRQMGKKREADRCAEMVAHIRKQLL